MNTTTTSADPALLLPRLLTLFQMLSISPSGTHSDKITVITSIKSMVVPMCLHSKKSHTLSLGQWDAEYDKLPMKFLRTCTF